LEGENQALAELNVLKSEQEMHVEALKKLALEKTAIVEQLQGQLTQTDQKMALLQEENQILMSELKSLQGIDFGALQKQVLEKSTVVEELQSKLRMTDQEIAHLKSENQSLLDLGAQSRAQEAHLESLKKQAAENENALKQIREQLVLAEKTIVLLTEEKKTLTEQLGQAAVRADQESLAIPQEMLEADRSFRRMKGLYEQLKCQFADKSAVLDETRKQLFHLEEKFMQHQIDMQERETFGYSDIEKALEKQLIETQKNYAKMHRETVQEVEGLYEVIDNLLKQNV
jgi:chromosome segregation ATPase